MRFNWERTDEGWRLSGSLHVDQRVLRDSSITVRNDRGLWTVYVHDAPLMPGNYTSEEAAKRSAWTFVVRNSRALFGAYKVKLAD